MLYKLLGTTVLTSTPKRETGMNLQKTIADLEQQAAKYTEAANALRALVDSSPAPDAAPEQATTTKQGSKGAQRRAGTKGSKKGSKRTMSAEARAKIGAATKAR